MKEKIGIVPVIGVKKIIAVASAKGGVGKSTISQNLAVCFAHMGYKVAIVDTDTNASSVHWSGIREEDLPHITVMGIATSDALRKNIKQLEKDYILCLRWVLKIWILMINLLIVIIVQ